MIPPFIVIDPILENWLREDIGRGDRSTSGLFPNGQAPIGNAVWIAKADGVIAGLPIAARVFQLLDPDVKFEGCMSKHKASGKDYKEAYSMCMSELIVEPVAMEEMDTNIGDCIAKRMKEDSSLTQEEARKRCAASVVVQPSGGSNPAVVG